MQDHSFLGLGTNSNAQAMSDTTVEPRSADWLDARHLWAELVAGRSAVAETFQRAGRSYLVFTHSVHKRRRALTDRELEVTRLMASGFTDKEIGNRLGIAVSSVATHRTRAQRKLGIGSRAMLTQLIHLLEDDGAHADSIVVPGTDRHEPLTVPLPDWSERLPSRLTRAEREVALLLLEGLSNTEISLRRGTSDRTVANQIASIGKKTGVSGRRALAAALLRECIAGVRAAGCG